ncbi:MAG: DUF5610 domain-containing protein [Algicola sp.]|nr:DUF5610 domain-containing protein [Algicola sp.]
MNFGEIKSFLQGTSLFDANPAGQARGPQDALANIKPNLSKLVSSASIVQQSQSMVLSFNVLNKVMSDKLASLDPESAAASKKNESLFDFEEVAKNVLSFIEKAVMKAKGDGSDDERLSSMLEHARKGVEEGFAQARKELGAMGQVDDEVEGGINKAYDAIQNGLDRFENKLFGTVPEMQDTQISQLAATATEINYSLSKSSSISIQTNDGDIVTINFAEALRYQASQQSASYSTENEDGSTSNVQYSQTSESRYHAVGFSFSVEGELDEDEREAIGALVQDVSKLADEFFNGNLDKAFEQATQLGFDESELSGFSLQMTRTESISVAHAYQQVAQYEGADRPGRGHGREHGQGHDNGEQSQQNIGQLIKPVANYLKDLMAFIEQAQEKLRDGNDLQELMSSSVSKYLEFKGEVNISASMERFVQFNQQMLSTLQNETAVEPPADDPESAPAVEPQGIAVGEPTSDGTKS